jgi:hypothetical protein
MEKKVQAIILQIQSWSPFSQKYRAQIDQKTLPRSRIMHRTTKTKSWRIRPAMATLILAQHNNQPTIQRRQSK